MIRDYSRRHPSGNGRQQNVYRRSAVRPSGGGFLWKAVGVFASFAVVVGVAASLWLGWQIDSGLSELAATQQLRQDARVRNAALLARRDRLRGREHVEAAVARLGLYPPSAQQVQRP